MSSPVSYLEPAQLQRDLGIRDLSDPAEGPHAIQILIGQAVDGLARAWGCEVRWCRGPRIVPAGDNYDRLGYPAGRSPGMPAIPGMWTPGTCCAVIPVP